MTKKFISNYIVYQSQVYVNSVINVGEDGICIEKFENETAFTEFVDGILAVIENDEQIAEIEKYVRCTSRVTSDVIEYLKNIESKSTENSKTQPKLVQIVASQGIVKLLSVGS